MPTCVRCHAWSSLSDGLDTCPACGGELRSREGLGRLEAEARSRDLTLAEVEEEHQQARVAGLRAAAEARQESRQALPPHWDHDPPGDQGQGELFVLVGIVLPLTALLGAVVFVAFLLLGLPAWIPIVGALVGVLGGWPLYFVAFAGSRWVFDRLAYRSRWVDRRGEDVWGLLVMVAFLLPPGVVIGTSMVLLGIVR